MNIFSQRHQHEHEHGPGVWSVTRGHESGDIVRPSECPDLFSNCQKCQLMTYHFYYDNYKICDLVIVIINFPFTIQAFMPPFDIQLNRMA